MPVHGDSYADLIHSMMQWQINWYNTEHSSL